jgi:hypothetical protein
MDLSNDVQQRAEADRRELDPPIHVDGTWSRAGQLDWWVKERRNGGLAYAMQTAIDGGSALMIFVQRTAPLCRHSASRHRCHIFYKDQVSAASENDLVDASDHQTRLCGRGRVTSLGVLFDKIGLSSCNRSLLGVEGQAGHE